MSKQPPIHPVRTACWRAVALLQAGGFVLHAQASERLANLNLEIVPSFNGSPLVLNARTNTTTAGQLISVTRLDFLISEVKLRRADNGNWRELHDSFFYASASEAKTRIELRGLSKGRYDRLQFLIGLRPEHNQSDASAYPADHPLNPAVNRLHWGWTGGYVFLALEGHWNQPGGTAPDGGYSFHLATDRHLMRIELPIDLELLASDADLRLFFNVDRVFAVPHEINLDEATATTHSREGDALANQIRENVEQAFGMEKVAFARTEVSQALSPARKREMAPEAKPYRLIISQFFPRPALPSDNPITEEGVQLGERLFLDPQLSVNDSQSCSSCHQPEAAFVDRGRPVSTGAEGKRGTRNSMPLFNLAWKSSYFWDGRAASLREQVLQPIVNPVEMHESLTNVVEKLRLSRDAMQPAVGADKAANYPSLFARAFGTSEITADRIARALEQYLLTRVSHDSKFDRVLRGQAQFSAEEQRGFELFHTEYDPRRAQFGADCFHCHGGPFFQSQSFGNNGLEIRGGDWGRHLVTGREGDRGKFAVPSLRNVELTAPYMHDGRIGTLEQVIEHYSSGVRRSPTLDPNLAKHPDGGVPLTAKDKEALVVFLKTLTDRQFSRPPWTSQNQ